MIHSRTIPIKILKCLKIRQIFTLKLFHAHHLSYRSLSLCISIHEIHVGKLRIGVTTHVARNLNGEWRFKPTKNLYPLNSTVRSTASTLHFRTHIPVRNLLAYIPSTCFFVFNLLFWIILYLWKIIYLLFAQWFCLCKIKNDTFISYLFISPQL